jgi:hypothetical protein
VEGGVFVIIIIIYLFILMLFGAVRFFLHSIRACEILPPLALATLLAPCSLFLFFLIADLGFVKLPRPRRYYTAAGFKTKTKKSTFRFRI